MAKKPALPLPPKSGDAPLQELDRDSLSVFLYMSFTGKELADLVRELKITVPGFRLEGLSDPERADVLADEIREYPDARKPVIERLKKVYEFPAFESVVLDPFTAGEFSRLAAELDAPVRMLWRVLADPSAEIRKAALPALAHLVKDFYGPVEKKEGEQRPSPRAQVSPEDADAKAKLARAEKELETATREARRAKEREDAIKSDLDAFRADVAKSQKELAAARAEKAELARKLAQLEDELEAAKQRPAGAERPRVKSGAEERIRTLEERTKNLEAERDAARRELDAHRKHAEARPAAAPAPANDDEAPLEALPSTWVLPHFTREFYDSLDRWEPRVQRTAFKQAMLLAENHRHPSLRAIPLEGLPGYYRVRVATDVRLIYKRVERDVEILALIDREDLDRYVRQAKTR